MKQQEIYLSVYPATGDAAKASVTMHWVWDAERFVDSVRKAELKAAKDEMARLKREAGKDELVLPRTVEVVTRECYLQANGYKNKRRGRK